MQITFFYWTDIGDIKCHAFIACCKYNDLKLCAKRTSFENVIVLFGERERGERGRERWREREGERGRGRERDGEREHFIKINHNNDNHTIIIQCMDNTD